MTDPIPNETDQLAALRWRQIAYITRYGHQPLSCLLPADRLPLSQDDMNHLVEALGSIVERENSYEGEPRI